MREEKGVPFPFAHRHSPRLSRGIADARILRCTHYCAPLLGPIRLACYGYDWRRNPVNPVCAADWKGIPEHKSSESNTFHP